MESRGVARARRLSTADAARLLAGDLTVLPAADVEPDPQAAAIADAVANPLGRASLRLGHPAPPWAVALRWSPVSAVAAVPAPDAPGTVELVPSPSAALPDVLARLVDLVPRPVPIVTRPLVLPADVLDLWLTGAPRSALDAARVGSEARAHLLAIRSDLRATWAVSAELPTAAGRLASRALRIVDGGAAGLWRLTRLAEARGVAVLSPVPARDVWSLLVGVLATRPIAEVAA